jgi:hypothetical protein
MLPATSDRVLQNTSAEINERNQRQTEARVAWLAGAGPAAIEHRLEELDREWDIERFIETVAPTISLTGIALGATVNRKWLLLPTVVLGFLIQHALQGWCPPIPVLRRMGVRTIEEINEERFALKALRGDFEHVGDLIGNGRGIQPVMVAVRK